MFERIQVGLAAASLCSLLAVSICAGELDLVNTGLSANRDVVVRGTQVVAMYRDPAPPSGRQLVYYDAATGESAQIAPLGVNRAPDDVVITDHRVAFLAWEFVSRQDLNGDGDERDFVPHVYDLNTGVLTNLGLAAGTDLPTAFIRPRFAFTGRHLVFTVSERSENHGGTPGTKFNGDNDILDDVLHAFDTESGDLQNLGLDIPTNAYVVFGDAVVVDVTESLNPSIGDLNDDGSFNDTVPVVFDFTAGTTTSVGVAGGASKVSPGGLLAFGASEPGEQLDLNGDGDLVDSVIHTFDLRTGETRNLGLARGNFRWGDTLLTIVAREHADLGGQGQDLNNDGDKIDGVLHVFDPRDGSTINLALASNSSLGSAGGRVLFSVREAWQGGMDLNDDGDTNDSLMHLYEASSGAVTNLDAAVNQILPRSVSEAFAVQGLAEFGDSTDFNGDGDETDLVFALISLETGDIQNLGLAGFSQTGAGGRFLLSVSEYRQGETDLNGDGDISDTVHHFFEPGGDPVNLGWTTLSPTALGAEVLAVALRESDIRQDLNGDEDTLDSFLFVARFERTPEEQLQDLIDDVLGLELHHGIENALLAKLEAAQRALEEGDVDTAIATLNAFRNQVEAQSGKKIPAEEADALIEAVDELLAALAAL